MVLQAVDTFIVSSLFLVPRVERMCVHVYSMVSERMVQLWSSAALLDIFGSVVKWNVAAARCFSDISGDFFQPLAARWLLSIPDFHVSFFFDRFISC